MVNSGNMITPEEKTVQEPQEDPDQYITWAQLIKKVYEDKTNFSSKVYKRILGFMKDAHNVPIKLDKFKNFCKTHGHLRLFKESEIVDVFNLLIEERKIAIKKIKEDLIQQKILKEQEEIEKQKLSDKMEVEDVDQTKKKTKKKKKKTKLDEETKLRLQRFAAIKNKRLAKQVNIKKAEKKLKNEIRNKSLSLATPLKNIYSPPKHKKVVFIDKSQFKDTVLKLLKPGKDLKLKTLKKMVFAAYKSTQKEVPREVRDNFNKKLNKIPNVVVDIGEEKFVKLVN